MLCVQVIVLTFVLVGVVVLVSSTYGGLPYGSMAVARRAEVPNVRFQRVRRTALASLMSNAQCLAIVVGFFALGGGSAPVQVSMWCVILGIFVAWV